MTDVLNLSNESQYTRQLKWDIRFMKLAKWWALECSKDPSTKCGCVIVRDVNKLVSTGYNGFAQNVRDYAERLIDRDMKYPLVLHCEENAFIRAEGRPLKGCTIYTWPFQSCAHCASLCAQYGIFREVSIPPSVDIMDRWSQSIHLSNQVFHEAGISLRLLDKEICGVDNWQAICNDMPLSPPKSVEEGKVGS